MTAENLYEIVKDVDSDAWPQGVFYDWNTHGPKRAKHWHGEDGRIAPDLAVLAFTGSMFAYIKDGGWHWQKWTMDKHKARTVSLEVPGHKFTVPMDAYPSGLWTVALLALACKQIAS